MHILSKKTIIIYDIMYMDIKALYQSCGCGSKITDGPYRINILDRSLDVMPALIAYMLLIYISIKRFIRLAYL